MCFFFSLIPGTVWVVIGFFILFASTKAEGRLRNFARILAIWTFVIGALFPLGGMFVTLAGLCPMEAMLEAVGAETALSSVDISFICGCEPA